MRTKVSGFAVLSILFAVMAAGLSVTGCNQQKDLTEPLDNVANPSNATAENGDQSKADKTTADKTTADKTTADKTTADKTTPDKATDTQPEPEQAKVLAAAELGGTRNVTQFGDIFLAGQFEESDVATLKEKGVEVVVTLRTDGEIPWDEKAAVESAGMKFVKIPFRAPETLTDDVFNDIRNMFKENADKKVLLHCGSANRVGAVWAAYRAINQNLPIEDAISEGKKVGLRNADYETRTREFIQQNLKEDSATDDN